MHESQTRLIDEAIADEPIKNTFRLGWEFITLNKTFTFSIISLLVILSLLGQLPVVGFIFMFLFSVLSLAVQIYAGRLVYESDHIESFVHEVKVAKGEKALQRYFAPAVGAYSGWLLLGIALVLVLSLFIGSMGVNESMINNNAALIALLAKVAIPVLLVALVFSYVQPLVQANIVMSNSFKEGFFAVMTLFSAQVWSDAFQARYFNYMALLGLIVLLVSFLFGFLFTFFGAIPIINIIVVMLFVYMFMIIMSVAAMMARRIVES